MKKIRESGEYDKLCAKWMDEKRDGNVMGDYHYSGKKGTMKIATLGLWTPMSFYAGDELTGLFVELTNGFCADAGYKPYYETVGRTAEVTGLANGDYDIAADAMLMTEERLKVVNITDSLMTDTIYMIVNADLQQKKVSKASVFIKGIKESYQRTFITEDRYKVLLSGLGVTTGLSIIVGLFGTLLGGLICFFRMRKNPWIEAAASLYIRFFRGIPIVVLLLVLYYVVFKDSSLTAFRVAAAAFSIDFSAYCSEIFRSGIEAVPAGQARAAKAPAFCDHRDLSSFIRSSVSGPDPVCFPGH